MSRKSVGPLSTLSRRQIEALRRFADEARDVPLHDLYRDAIDHLAVAHRAHRSDPLVNVALAEALADVIRRLADAWDTGHFRPQVTTEYDTGYWLRGAIRYFSQVDDEEPDLSSPLGFEDDAEVLNACLRLAGLDAWCINPEQYDDA